ncbi:hypothetical protein BX666DRAFT_1898909 [Dichotomocladium elegans]|nr:hypothetical protein BX666DRAFT_1898909 [Dichotomocladium elegans]
MGQVDAEEQRRHHRPVSAPIVTPFPPPIYTADVETKFHPADPSLSHQTPPPAYQPLQQHQKNHLPDYYYSSSSSSYQQQPFANGATYYYQPTPPPQTVIIQQTPSRTNDACCLGWYSMQTLPIWRLLKQLTYALSHYIILFFLYFSIAALCLCFASEEFC